MRLKTRGKMMLKILGQSKNYIEFLKKNKVHIFKKQSEKIQKFFSNQFDKLYQIYAKEHSLKTLNDVIKQVEKVSIKTLPLTFYELEDAFQLITENDNKN